MSDNLPDKLRPLTELLSLPPEKLTKHELAIVNEFARGLEAQQQDEDAFDPEFQKIGVVATSGKAMFVLPDDTTVKYIDTVILLHKKHQQYYGPKTDEFPEGVLYCRAYGNQEGRPTPEGIRNVPFLKKPPYTCFSCPANSFGSGDGNSKACANTFRLIVQLDTFEQPLRLNVPPTSRRVFNTYANTARTNRIYLCTRYTKITPHYESEGGIEWATLSFERGDEIPSSQLLAAMTLHNELCTKWDAEKEALYSGQWDGPEEGAGKRKPQERRDEPPPPGDDDLPF